jgi:UDP-glucuronate 4-epimerase
MASAVITGCAGFIGSHLARACLAAGDKVLGVDLLTDYYDVAQKRSNLSDLLEHPRFEFVQTDLADGCERVVAGADVVYHLAGQPGVRASWRQQFDEYTRRNITATQRVLEAATSQGTGRVVYASSSSVYGRSQTFPFDERHAVVPHSPYGVTKLAAEHLCSLYAANFGLSTVSLRYFTVYGPAQRPDMATHRLFEAALGGTPFPLYGDGQQARDFTYVGDVVAANLAAAGADVAAGAVFNVAGGSSCTMRDLIADVESLTGRTIRLELRAAQHGDVPTTSASTERARTQLGWQPNVSLRTGLERQMEWHAARRADQPAPIQP